VSVLEEELAAIGFGAGVRPDTGAWRVERLGAGTSNASDCVEPELDSDLSIFSDLLRNRKAPPIYRVRRMRP
jgi:hypothetical protein